MELIEVYINGIFHGTHRVRWPEMGYQHKAWYGENDFVWINTEVIGINGQLRAMFTDPRLEIKDRKVWMITNRQLLPRWQRPAFTKHMKVSRPRAGRIK